MAFSIKNKGERVSERERKKCRRWLTGGGGNEGETSKQTWFYYYLFP